MIDHAQRQRRITVDDRLSFIAENVSQEAWVSGVNARKWPTGARYFYALQEVWGPTRYVKKQEERHGAK